MPDPSLAPVTGRGRPRGAKPRATKDQVFAAVSELTVHRGKSKSSAERSKGKTVCIFLGTERLAEMQARAEKLGYSSFSAYIAALGDAGLDLKPADLTKLRALATVKRVNLSSLVAELIRKAVR